MRFATVVEPARHIISEHRTLTGEENLDARPDMFVRRMTGAMISEYAAAGPGTTVYDRALPDCIAYLAAYGLETAAAEDVARRHAYEGPVFLFPPWPEIYRTDDMRKATFDIVEAFHRHVVVAYEALGYDLIEVPRLTVDHRVRWITDRIE